ncbi:MAG: hypothetical protein TQ37_10725 [Candidatus Synechococcus spongiarum 15L]|uniref:HTH cro/C1-type domain-containing protein n=2 Tax=Candidatus Synechococcus spongiarum TaxID=431041 RepID=A0A1T1D6K2_9SYNE|nr:RodZ domain-containing protein [Candidatus Synechococcus spongiarum]KKZ09928.1 MAG: hypothetical protein TQ37_10725 [Candidatus Synechococcus spongiarum 15L]OOV36484.1 hypothetical protein BV53_00545 [Candidatus Synechococcus spongiarum LMB bulk15N]
MRFPEGLELRTYGQQLLAGREAKGWTQQQLSKKLFLPVHFIRALEAGEHGMLPEIPYVMSMYRKVATAVGVDPEPMIQACKAFQAQEGQALINRTQPGEAVRTRNPSLPGPQRQSSAPPTTREAMAASQRKARAGQGKGDWMIVLVGCGLGLVLVALALLNSQQLNSLWLAMRPRPTITDPAAETVGETENQSLEALATRQQQTTDIPDILDMPDIQPVSPDGQLEQQPEELESGTVRFIFAADANDNRSSWIRVEDARGVLLFENTPEPLASVDLPIAAGVRVRVGRPGLVRWQQPGQPPQSLPQAQADNWIELIPGPVTGQVDPGPLEADPLDPAPAPEPENVVPQETSEAP